MIHNINNTALVPYIIADKVAVNLLENDFESKEMLSLKLVEKAERIYSENENFRSQINSNKTDCRQVLEMFMENWAHGILAIVSATVLQAQKAGITGFMFYPQELIILMGSLVLGMLIATLPAIQAYRTDISRVLSGS